MKNRKWITGVVLVGLCAGMSGCLSVQVGSKESSKVKTSGLVDGYVACNGIRPYDGIFIDADALSQGSERWGDLLSLDVWPIGGVGISFIGARIKILPFEAGFGLFGESPRPENYFKEQVELEVPEACDATLEGNGKE